MDGKLMEFFVWSSKKDFHQCWDKIVSWLFQKVPLIMDSYRSDLISEGEIISGFLSGTTLKSLIGSCLEESSDGTKP